MAEPSPPPPDGSPASPAALDLSRGDELEKYTLRSARQILQLLQDLITHRCLITAHTGGGHSFMTAVLKVDEERARVVLDPSPDPQANRRALAAPRLTCATQLDGIRIQFPLLGLSEGQDKGRPAFFAPLPTEMLRLQRREFYRLQVPLAHALNCLLRAEDLARKPVEVSARVIDIGAGGVAVVVPAGAAEFVIGGVLPACRLALPDGDPIELELEVRNLNRQTQRNGTEQLRVGLRFAALPRTADTRIQRYIFKTERELNAKARGGI